MSDELTFNNFEIRKLQRTGYCRCCGEVYTKEAGPVCTMDSQNQRDSLLIICQSCVIILGSLVKAFKESNIQKELEERHLC